MNAPNSQLLHSLQEKILQISAKKDFTLIAIDGRCASGKTTLAGMLKNNMNCNVIPMDHFFLQPHMRSVERLSQPGGNVDHERFLKEVLLPLTKDRSCSYRPYSCRTGKLEDSIILSPAPITIVEGSYSCHPALQSYYDYRIFLTTSYENQLQRIAIRNGEEALSDFIKKWIPLEELYFKEMNIAAQCDFVFTT